MMNKAKKALNHAREAISNKMKIREIDKQIHAAKVAYVHAKSAAERDREGDRIDELKRKRYAIETGTRFIGTDGLGARD
ncbi:hypothetical protein [Cohnella yongneupensis]|uniref:DUF3886 domain-containing protein n=1 Tax=Cohnella yongneupensis TaxID=425006 RepID=A0ABW0R4W7_9BACL